MPRRTPTLRPSNRTIAGTLAVLAVVDDRLGVVCRRDIDGSSLPTFDPAEGAGLDDLARDAVGRVVTSGTAYLEQLYTFTADERPESTNVVVSYLALVSDDDPIGPGFELLPADVALAQLSGVQQRVVEYAVVRLRAKIGYTTIAFHLMPFEFTLSELQKTYETILGVPLDKRNFRRRILASGLVSPTDGRRAGANHRPAALYQFTAEHDPSAFLTPTTAPRPTASNQARS